MNRYDVVTFDMGSTLVYFHPSDNEVYLGALGSLGLYPDPEELRRARDEIWAEYFAGAASLTYEPTPQRDEELERELTAQSLARLGFGGPGLVARVMEAAKAAFKAPGVVRVYPEVFAVLQALRRDGCRLGVISNWSWDLHEFVDQAGLTPHFDVIVASARTGCEKPHPEIFRRALEALRASPARALHVGDSYQADVLGARGVGMDALWLDRPGCGGHPDCHSIRDLNEVLAAVRR